MTGIVITADPDADAALADVLHMLRDRTWDVTVRVNTAGETITLRAALLVDVDRDADTALFTYDEQPLQAAGSWEGPVGAIERMVYL